MLKKLTAFGLTVFMLLTATACGNGEDNSSTSSATEEATKATEATTEEATEYEPVRSDKTINGQGLADNISDGAILHTWCWSFNTIKEHMKDIADAGFSTIQTSPINQCKVGEDGGMQLQDKGDSINKGKWYYHYQPTDYVIGNYQLGTKEEFTAMCEEADKYGIKVIVDVVANHMSGDKSVLSENMTSLNDPFHNLGDVSDYSDRKEVTQGNLLGLTDLNTQNEEIQQCILNYLKECVEAGADGFRYDAAKHIELDSDDSAYASNFWNVVLNNGSKFQYGEILQGGSDRITSYGKIMNVTASEYGETLRNSVINEDVSVGSLRDYAVNGMDTDNIVTWVESHDNYCNDGNWSAMDETQIKQAWAIICAREGGTPLFFDRPAGSSTDDQWGDNKIGAMGSDFFTDKEVTAVNKFRTAMIGEEENLTNPNDNISLIMIERGEKGAVIVNVSDNDEKLEDVETNLADGTYKDKVNGSEFKVKDGKMNGTVKKNAVVVLYN
ncbi:MAG: alpha-amylase family glycosyl hydrolase [Acutalibacteraceae bacterium]|nr:alpha-amylase family glycosyl hydrolase [Acutalibacteraceae bacterium]